MIEFGIELCVIFALLSVGGGNHDISDIEELSSKIKGDLSNVKTKLEAKLQEVKDKRDSLKQIEKEAKTSYNAETTRLTTVRDQHVWCLYYYIVSLMTKLSPHNTFLLKYSN
jgi:FtsZ-binding cell division protein ZapB